MVINTKTSMLIFSIAELPQLQLPQKQILYVFKITIGTFNVQTSRRFLNKTFIAANLCSLRLLLHKGTWNDLFNKEKYQNFI